MSYSIIFETKFCKLEDGRYIHFDLSGCNNDNCGRTRDDWSAKIYTEEELDKYIESFETDDNSYSELKIGSKWCTWKDFGAHLRRMKNKALSFDELVNDYRLSARVFTGVTVFFDDNTSKEYTPDEWKDICYKYYYKTYESKSIRSHYHFSKDLDEIIKCLEKQGEHPSGISFYIGRKAKQKVNLSA